MRAICGGGRYDRLLAASGGPDLPALGFGMGDVVLSDLVRARGLMPPFGASVDVYVVAGGGDTADDRDLSEVMLRKVWATSEPSMVSRSNTHFEANHWPLSACKSKSRSMHGLQLSCTKAGG